VTLARCLFAPATSCVARATTVLLLLFFVAMTRRGLTLHPEKTRVVDMSQPERRTTFAASHEAKQRPQPRIDHRLGPYP
jgi:hypothetical protein